MFGLLLDLIIGGIIGVFIFGSSRFGELGRSLESTIREFRAACKEPAEQEEEKSQTTAKH